MELTTELPKVKATEKDIHNFRIKPAGKEEIFYICQYNDPTEKNVLKSILSGGKHGMYHEGPVPVGQTVLSFTLAPYGSNKQHYINIECDLKNRGDEGTKLITKFWKNCPVVKVQNYFPANPNQIPNPSFVMEDISETKTNKVTDIFRRGKATSKFMALTSERAKKNVAYFFGVTNADRMDEEELFITLFDPSNGIMFSPDNMDKFLGTDKIEAYTPENERVQISINTHRAIEKGIIEFKNGSYLINNHPVGRSPEDVIGYLDNNKDFYLTYIIEKLGDIAEMKKEQDKKETQGIVETIDLSGLKVRCKQLFEEAKALGLKGLGVGKAEQTMTVGKLQGYIAEAEEAIAMYKNKN